MQGQMKMNLGKLENSENLKIPFWMKGNFGDHLWWTILLLAILDGSH